MTSLQKQVRKCEREFCQCVAGSVTERNRTERTPTFPLEHCTLKHRKCHCACGRLLRHGVLGRLCHRVPVVGTHGNSGSRGGIQRGIQQGIQRGSYRGPRKESNADSQSRRVSASRCHSLGNFKSPAGNDRTSARPAFRITKPILTCPRGPVLVGNARQCPPGWQEGAREGLS